MFLAHGWFPRWDVCYRGYGRKECTMVRRSHVTMKVVASWLLLLRCVTWPELKKVSATAKARRRQKTTSCLTSPGPCLLILSSKHSFIATIVHQHSPHLICSIPSPIIHTTTIRTNYAVYSNIGSTQGKQIFPVTITNHNNGPTREPKHPD